MLIIYLSSVIYVVIVILIHDFFQEAILYILANLSVALTSSLAFFIGSVSCASADVLTSFAFVIPVICFYLVWWSMRILFLLVYLLKSESCLKAGGMLGKLLSMFHVKGEWLFMYKQVQVWLRVNCIEVIL